MNTHTPARRVTTLWRVQRFNQAGQLVAARIFTQKPAANRLAARWASWPSTGRIALSSTLAPPWQPAPTIHEGDLA